MSRDGSANDGTVRITSKAAFSRIVNGTEEIVAGWFDDIVYLDRRKPLYKVSIGSALVYNTKPKYGVVNSSGKLIIPVEYNDISYLKCDIIKAIKDFTNSSGITISRYDLFDLKGNLILRFDNQVQSVSALFNTMLVKYNNGTFALYNLSGERLNSCDQNYTSCNYSPFICCNSPGLLVSLTDTNGITTVYDAKKNWREVLSPTAGNVSFMRSEIVVTLNGKETHYNPLGIEI